ncbi:zeta toxin family protein [Streptomyces acidicola]|uniref:zeta toxin family protein n=1 Tax=Streptomyces acidicola TaxID=2596892 RepID=UPI0037F3FFB8
MSNPATQARPVVVVAAGQPGAGKTQVADLVQAVLDRHGGAVRLGRALYESAHRHYRGRPGRRRPDSRSAGPSRHRPPAACGRG